MRPLDALPPWAAILAAVLVLLGALFTCIGSLGLLRLKNFYQRVHAPTLGTTLGTFLVLGASIVCFSIPQGRAALPAILIGAFLLVTTPIGLMLLVRAALYRDHKAGANVAPPQTPPPH